jgi:hypothetical protein
MEEVNSDLASTVFVKVYVIDTNKFKRGDDFSTLKEIRPFLFEYEFNKDYVIYYDKYEFVER